MFGLATVLVYPPALADSWSESAACRALKQGDLGRLHAGLRLGTIWPNLRDVHGDDGAVATLLDQSPGEPEGREAAILTLLLKAAGHEDTDDWLIWVPDEAEVRLPEAATRHPVPKGSAVVSITAGNQVRASAGDEPSVPIAIADLAPFCQHWQSLQPGLDEDVLAEDAQDEDAQDEDAQDEDAPVVEPPAAEASGEPQTVKLVLRGRERFALDKSRLETADLRDALAARLAESQELTVVVQGKSKVRAGDLFAVLDSAAQLEAVSRLRFVVPAPDPKGQAGIDAVQLRLRPAPASPAVALKLDAELPLPDLQRALQEVAVSGVRSIVLLTELRIPADRSLPPRTFPGALPGGFAAEIQAVVDGDG